MDGHSQLPLAQLGKPSPNIDLLRIIGSRGEQFSLFDLDLCHTTLTDNPRLATVKVNPHA